MNKTISFLGDRVTYTGINQNRDWTVPDGVSSITYLVAESMPMGSDCMENVLFNALVNLPWPTPIRIYTDEEFKQYDYHKRMKTLWSSA